MHYANNRVAKLGDQVVFKDYNNQIQCGVLASANPTSGCCDGVVAPAIGGNIYQGDLKRMYHIEDAFSTTEQFYSAAPAVPVGTIPQSKT